MTKGVVIATCCHHKCSYSHYFGKEIMSEFGFTPSDCELLFWMSGWALCGHAGCCGQDQVESDCSPCTGQCSSPFANASASHRFETSQSRVLSPKFLLDERKVASVPAATIPKEGTTTLLPSAATPLASDLEECWMPRFDISRERRMVVGRLCKRIIDYGRAEQLRRMSTLRVKLVSFCDPSVSGENTLLVGYDDRIP